MILWFFGLYFVLMKITQQQLGILMGHIIYNKDMFVLILHALLLHLLVIKVEILGKISKINCWATIVITVMRQMTYDRSFLYQYTLSMYWIGPVKWVRNLNPLSPSPFWESIWLHPTLVPIWLLGVAKTSSTPVAMYYVFFVNNIV